MAEVIRIVASSVNLTPVRPEPDPVVMRGITLVPHHGVPVVAQVPPGSDDGHREDALPEPLPAASR